MSDNRSVVKIRPGRDPEWHSGSLVLVLDTCYVRRTKYSHRQ
jgi:hypothetical protein